MRIKRMEKLAERIMDWCAVELGYSKFHDGLPIIDVSYSDGVGVKGEYEAMNNAIYFYTKEIRSVRQLVQTVIHEYCHYLQSPCWLERYARTVSAKKNRYEMQAEAMAWLHFKECMDALRLK